MLSELVTFCLWFSGCLGVSDCSAKGRKQKSEKITDETHFRHPHRPCAIFLGGSIIQEVHHENPRVKESQLRVNSSAVVRVEMLDKTWNTMRPSSWWFKDEFSKALKFFLFVNMDGYVHPLPASVKFLSPKVACVLGDCRTPEAWRRDTKILIRLEPESRRFFAAPKVCKASQGSIAVVVDKVQNYEEGQHGQLLTDLNEAEFSCI